MWLTPVSHQDSAGLTSKFDCSAQRGRGKGQCWDTINQPQWVACQLPLKLMAISGGFQKVCPKVHFLPKLPQEINARGMGRLDDLQSTLLLQVLVNPLTRVTSPPTNPFPGHTNPKPHLCQPSTQYPSGFWYQRHFSMQGKTLFFFSCPAQTLQAFDNVLWNTSKYLMYSLCDKKKIT